MMSFSQFFSRRIPITQMKDETEQNSQFTQLTILHYLDEESDEHMIEKTFALIFATKNGECIFTRHFSIINYSFSEFVKDALMNSLNSGCGRFGLDLNSGWNCEATNQG